MPFSQAFLHIVIVSAGTWGLGRFLIGRHWQFGHKPLQIAAESAAGLLFLSCFIFVLSAFHLISRNTLFILLAALGLAAASYCFFHPSPQPSPLRGEGRVRGKISGLNFSDMTSQSRTWFLPALASLFYFVWIAACAYLPASDRDEMIYHLEIPKQFLAHSSLAGFQDNIYGYFPQLGEMLFLFGMGTSGELAAKFYHILCGALLALGLYGYSRAYLNKKNAGLVVLVLLSVPVVMVTLPLAYVDLVFSLYAFLALVCLLNFFKTSKLRWSVLSGIFAGACMATKYTGIQILALLVCLSLLKHLSERRKGWPVGTLALASASLPVFAPYLWRNWTLTGWPLFPFNIGHFTLHPGINWDAERARLYLGWLGTFGAPLGGQTLWHILFAPVLVFITARFNDPQFYEGILGPVFLLTPFFLMLGRSQKPKEIRWLMIFSALFLYYWAFTTKQSRFLIPLLPVLGFLLVYGLAGMKKKIPYVLTAALVFFNFYTGIKELCAKNPFPYWLNRETREHYLARQLPVYPIYQEANKQLGPSDRLYLINMKNYLYYLDVPVRTDLVFERYSLDGALRDSPSVDNLTDFFNRLDISHLLIDEAFVLSPDWGMEPGPSAVFRNFLLERTKPLARDRNFVLYRLKESGSP